MSEREQLGVGRDNTTEAASLRQQTQGIVERIADHASMPELRASFLDSSDVRAVLFCGLNRDWRIN